ncbi:MAG: hypothetical protein JHC87_05450 [Thermoleophilaceae bacterium]|nr:hypothetical protein [Thermoleophilaceae bacterium]
MDTLLDIFTAIGIGAAAGLAPLVAIAATVLLATLHVGINPESSDFKIITDSAFVLIAVVVLVQSLLSDTTPGGLRFRIAADRPRLAWLIWVVAAVCGGFAGAVVFEAQAHPPAVGAVLAGASAVLVSFAATGFFGRVGARLQSKAQANAAKHQDKQKDAGKDQAADKTSGRSLALLVDVLTLIAVVLALVVPPTGLILPIFAVVLLFGVRRKKGQKYEGLRVLR